ncbi:hypothetical protein [Halopelagius longus]|uniref:Uncharacterized protein n=1 Tax=Halopelagius longus TaxID=1236180 RepID=A0A1H1GFZ0_9EURY|nr:hypothetical protein [Halopelagius longus]RDI69615.1 hypothetical protein DWB78_17740 [Halopelagius longus]SDR12091.1 hypothetical protein SAMN05216278_3646 [Halopelagius longus]
MSLAITHFVVGATATMLVVIFFLPRVRFPRTLMVLGGLWAMIPDLNKVVPSELGFVDAVHDSAWANVFWAHHFLDTVDPSDTTKAAVLALAVFFLVSLVAEGVGYHLRFSEPASNGGRTRTSSPFETATESRASASSGAFAASPPFRLAYGVRQAGGLCSVVVGTGLLSFVFRTPEYTGLLAGIGLLLELSGLVVLLEGIDPDEFARRVPSWVSTGTKTALTLGSSLVVVALLVTLSNVTPLSVAYAGISVLVVLQLVRLWELPI